MITELPEKSHAKSRRGATPRLGFLGVGWIGRNRMEAIAQSGLAEIAAIAEPVPELCAQASKISPEAAVCASIDELLQFPLDGIVIATPSALHAEQAIAAMRAGMNVFCQKPLGRTGAETAQVVEVARAENKLLGVDLSYRHIDEVRAVTDLVHSGEIGDVFAVDLVFHNAYGPDKAWFYDPKLSGGGCVIDLGIHLVDLGLWALNFPAVENVSSRLYSRGKPISSAAREIEDYAVARLDLQNGASIQLACSWKLQAGCDAIISGTFYGTKGGAQFRNVNGSFFDFAAERFNGTNRQEISSCKGGWGGRAAVDWARRLTEHPGYDTHAGRFIEIANVLDAIYGRSSAPITNGS